MTVIIWIDPNIDGDDENKSYFKELNDENVGYEIYRAKTVHEGMTQINNILFKEKERRYKKKANRNHKFTDPIVRKKGREKQIQDDREKLAKEDTRKKAQFQKLTTDINELIISNKDLKEEIVNLRKQK